MLTSQFGIPGSSNAVFTQTNEIFWGGDVSRIMILLGQGIYDGAARSAGTNPTTVLPAGLLVGKVTATGKLVQWDSGAVDGSEAVYGILPVELVMLNPIDGTDSDKAAPSVVWAPVKATALYIKGAALIGHADEAAARTGLGAKGFLIDDEMI